MTSVNSSPNQDEQTPLTNINRYDAHNKRLQLLKKKWFKQIAVFSTVLFLIPLFALPSQTVYDEKFVNSDCDNVKDTCNNNDGKNNCLQQSLTGCNDKTCYLENLKNCTTASECSQIPIFCNDYYNDFLIEKWKQEHIMSYNQKFKAMLSLDDGYKNSNNNTANLGFTFYLFTTMLLIFIIIMIMSSIDLIDNYTR